MKRLLFILIFFPYVCFAGVDTKDGVSVTTGTNFDGASTVDTCDGQAIKTAASCTTLEDSCAGGGETSNRKLSSDSTNIYLAAPFTVDSSYTVCSVYYYLKKIGSPSFNLNAYIYDDNSGDPGSLVGTGSSAVAANSLSTSNGYINFPGMSAAVSAGTYWLVLKASAEGDASNYVAWESDTACDIGDGVHKSAAVISWSRIHQDYGFLFKTYK